MPNKPEIIISDAEDKEIFKKPESDFIRAEIKKAARTSTGIITIFTLELVLKDNSVLDQFSDLESGIVKLVNGNAEKGINITGFDQYKIYINRENKTIESLSLSGTII
jgi:hypothetical protein